MHFGGFKGEPPFFLFQLLEATFIPCLMSPDSSHLCFHGLITLSDSDIPTSLLQGIFDYFGPIQIIQANLPHPKILNFIISAKFILPCKVAYSPDLEVDWFGYHDSAFHILYQGLPRKHFRNISIHFSPTVVVAQNFYENQRKCFFFGWFLADTSAVCLIVGLVY